MAPEKSENRTDKSKARLAQIREERLSPVAENYLFSLYILMEEGIRTTQSHLAEYLKSVPVGEGLGTSLPSVMGMVRRMQREGLVETNKDKEVILTDKGRIMAEDMVRRHRLAERMVVDMLGMDLYRAHLEAHRLEHAISPELQTKIVERLGGPKTCPFGRPIPGSGYVSKSGVVSLDTAKRESQWVVERVPEEDHELLRFLVEHAIVPGQELLVKETAPYRGVISVQTDHGEVSLGYAVASRIWVVRAQR